MKEYMEINANTKVFAECLSSYLLTNEQEWDEKTINRKTFMVCRINIEDKEISPCLPLWQFINHNPYWIKPERQFTAKELEEIKNYKKV